MRRNKKTLAISAKHDDQPLWGTIFSDQLYISLLLDIPWILMISWSNSWSTPIRLVQRPEYPWNLYEILEKDRNKTNKTYDFLGKIIVLFCDSMDFSGQLPDPLMNFIGTFGENDGFRCFLFGKRTSENPDIPHPFSGFPHPFRPFWWNSTGSPVATPGPYKKAAAPPVGAAAPWAAATRGRWWRRRRRAPARPVRSPRRAGGPGRRRGRGPPPCLGKNGKTAARIPNSRKSTQQFDIVYVDLYRFT